MNFVERLREISSSNTCTLGNAMSEKLTQKAKKQLPTSILSEYKELKKACLRAAHRGETHCTIQFRRDRNGEYIAKSAIRYDKELSPQIKELCIQQFESQNMCFTSEEVELIRTEMHRKLAEDGFSNPAILTHVHPKMAFKEWNQCVEISVSW